MLENWSVTNFKSIPRTRVIKSDGQETDKLDLKPLTVFCGANSSGKSSLIQSILLMAQTMRGRDRETPIVLNGDYTSLGAFDDIRTVNSEGQIGICFTYKPESDSVVRKNEYPFNHVVWSNENKKDKDSKETHKYFCIESISSEFFFSHQDDKDEKTKILPEISKIIFTTEFFSKPSLTKKNDEKQTNTSNTEGKYILTWSISKSKDKDCYDFMETMKLPDDKTMTLRDQGPRFPFEFNIPREFQEKLAEQFELEITKITCGLNHFFPETIYRETNNKYGCFLELAEHILTNIGCHARFLNEIPTGILDTMFDTVGKFIDGYAWDDLKGVISEAIYHYIYEHIIYPSSGLARFEDEDNDRFPFVEMSETFAKSVPDNSSKWILDSSIFNGIDLELRIRKEIYFNREDDDEGHDAYYKNFKADLENDRKKIEERANDEKNIITILNLFLDFYKSMVNSWVDRRKCDSEEAIVERDELEKLEVWDKISRGLRNNINCRIQNDKIKQFSCGTSQNVLDDVSGFIQNHLTKVSDCFSNDIHYLGPLREDPKALYPYPCNDDSFDLGRKGEYTAGVLFLHGEKPAKNFPFPSREEAQNNDEDTVTIKEAIKQWLAYIGVADDIEAKLTDSGISLRIQTSGASKWSNLTNVGVGVSQVIPIVVMCLTAKKGTTLIIEQPELHLHPKMQTRLAEFFMAAANSGVQCIIETHSEHFINAMRLNIASDDLGKEEMMDKSVIYFVEKIQNASIFREIKINDLGIIPHWPKDFFDEGINQTDEIILASAKKRAQKFHEDEELDDE